MSDEVKETGEDLVFDECVIAYAMLKCEKAPKVLNGLYGIGFDDCLLDKEGICRTVDSVTDCLLAIEDRIGEPVTVERMKEYENNNPELQPKELKTN